MGVNFPGESDADACRRMGWVVGDRIEGDEGFGPDVWVITAIGRYNILTITEGSPGHEKQSTLRYRDWAKIGSDPKEQEDD